MISSNSRENELTYKKHEIQLMVFHSKCLMHRNCLIVCITEFQQAKMTHRDSLELYFPNIRKLSKRKTNRHIDFWRQKPIAAFKKTF